MLASFSAAFDACRDVLINSFIANSLPSFFDDKQCLLNTLLSFIFFNTVEIAGIIYHPTLAQRYTVPKAPFPSSRPTP